VSKKTLEKIFGQHGLLAKRLTGYHPRAAQLSMALAVEETIAQSSGLIAEAATGTGKTFAYLIPALLSRQKVLISTATKNLQDQLVYQDIPRILQVLGLAKTLQNLKGRDNYVCKHHLQRLLAESNAYQLSFYPDLVNIYEQLPHLASGDKAEIHGLAQDAWYWSEINARADHCLASKCPVQAECFLYLARQKAMAADCVVVNHHLFFADSRLKEDGFGALLPVFDIMVFDEAHQMVDIATHFYTRSFGSSSLLRICQELMAEPGLSMAGLVNILKPLASSVEQLVHHLESSDHISIPNLVATQKLPWQDWVFALEQVLAVLDTVKADVSLWRIRIENILSVIHLCLQAKGEGVAWLKKLKTQVRFQWTPFSVAAQTRELIASLRASLIFTSATLKTQGHFAWFQAALGLEEMKSMAWDSPYAWQDQALLYLPHALPDIYHPDYYSSLVTEVLPVIHLLGGRTLFLFTSHRALSLVAELLAKRCHYPLLVQGQADKTKLLADFRQQPQAILLGTGGFWEGVDVQGDCLSCVIIDKLPFSNIAEPMVAAKLKYLTAQGVSVFEDYLIPQAILTLKQGVGRLIRTEQDKGLIIIGDPRLYGRGYGRDFKQSLPPMPWTRSLPRVKHFLQTLTHEKQDETLLSV